MSPSSEARIWSGCTFGSVCESGIVEPSSSGSPFVPGSISIVMSWRPVRGRSSTVASARISGAYSSSTSIVTTALPSSSSTSEMSPTLTPAMFTVWPWPGVTACAVESSALSSKRSSPRTGTQDGYGCCCWERM